MCSWYVFNIVNTCLCQKQTRLFFFLTLLVLYTWHNSRQTILTHKSWLESPSLILYVSTLKVISKVIWKHDMKVLECIWGSLSIETCCLESLWHFPHWKLLEVLWTQSRVTYSTTPCLSKEIGPDNPQVVPSNLNHSVVLWFWRGEQQKMWHMWWWGGREKT